MSKNIKITDEMLNEVRQAFEDTLSTGKFPDGKLTFTKTFSSVDRKATVWFSETAWIKMQTLIREFNKEVAWHGIAKRGEDDSKDEYYITDILVYPQEVTGATVTTDQEKYQTWLMSHDDDTFNNIRMQGHSHVYMGVTPSSVDTSLYERILEQLDDDMFYIFMIWNKQNDKTIKIYDLAKNILFETQDVTVKILDDEIGLQKFLADAKTLVQDKASAVSYVWNSNSYNQPKTDVKTYSEPTPKKGKRKKNKGGFVENACDGNNRMSMLDDYDYNYDYISDPFYAKGY